MLPSRALLSCMMFGLLLGCSNDGDDSAEPGHIPAQFTQSDLNLVVFFIEDCPVGFSAVSVVQELKQQYQDLAIHWVYSTPFPDAKGLWSFRHEYGIMDHVTYDTNLVIAQTFGATVTPEVFLIDRTGNILYRGLVDDYFIAFGKHKAEATRHFLADAIEASKKGQPIAVPKTDAVGCIIEYDKLPEMPQE